MSEPIDPPIRTPLGGWPKTMLVVTLAPDLAPDLAFYELACLSRRLRMGVETTFQGHVLFGFPHQTADDIGRVYIKLRHAELRKRDKLPPENPGHWTPRYKVMVVEAVNAGIMSREDAAREYEIGDEELDGWIDRFSRFGMDGLRARKLQEVGR